MNAIQTADELNALAEQYHYWDAPVLGILGDAFLSELALFYECDGGQVVRYRFEECYTLSFSHVKEEIERAGKKRWKPGNYTHAQIDYFMQDVSFSLHKEGENLLYECRIGLSIAALKVLCGQVEIARLKLEELSPRERAALVQKS